MNKTLLRLLQALGVALSLVFLVIACAGSPQTLNMTVQSVPSQFFSASELSSPQQHEAYFQFIMGVRDELSRNIDSAKDNYERALEFDPSSPYLHARVAAIYAGKKDRDRALGHVDDALKEADIDANTQILLADVLVAIGALERAVTLYDVVIQRDTENHDVFIKKGVLLLSLNKLGEAKQALQRSVDIRPDLPIAYYHLGRVALGQDESEHAVRYFKRAIAGKQDFLPAYLALAKVYEETGSVSEAIEVHREGLMTLRGSPEVLRSELVRLYLKEQSYEPALVLLEEILQENPYNLEATLRVALLYIELQQFSKAATHLQKVVAQRPNDVMARDYLGLVFEESEAYEEAIKQYQHVLAIDDKYLDTIVHLGHLYYRLKNFEESVTLLQRAVQLEPQRVNLYLVLALGLTQLEHYHDAVDVLERGVALGEAVPHFHYHLGIVHEKLDQTAELIAHMQKTIALDPSHSDALNYLGYYYVERGIQLDEAMGLIKRAVSIQPDNGYYVDSLAWAYYKMGRNQEALLQLERAVTLVPDDPVIVQHLGEVYLSLGKQDEARKAWVRSLELNPDNQTLRDVFQKHGFGNPQVKEGI